MHPDFARLFHQDSKDLSDKGKVAISKDTSEWPDEWKTVHYKTYPRLPKILLPKTKPAMDLYEAVLSRHSRRDFNRKAISLENLSTLLQYSAGITREFEDYNPRRAHPSGGALYPLEIYPVVFSGSEEVPSGVYHYNIKEHALDSLWERPFSSEEIGRYSSYEWTQKASCMLVISSVFPRALNKYGQRGYRLIMLEAGHISQNVYLLSAALKLKCCAVSGVQDEEIEKLLQIDGKSESVVHVMYLG